MISPENLKTLEEKMLNEIKQLLMAKTSGEALNLPQGSIVEDTRWSDQEKIAALEHFEIALDKIKSDLADAFEAIEAKKTGQDTKKDEGVNKD